LKQGKGGSRKISKANEPDPADLAAKEAREAKQTEPVASVPAPAESPKHKPAPQTTESTEAERSSPELLLDPVAIARLTPAPHKPLSSASELIPEELAEFTRAEKILALTDAAYWLRGKMLHLVRDARQYRQEYETFDAYCTIRWGLTARRVNQLIEVWPVGEHLAATIGRKFPTTSINESHARALLTYAQKHGIEAAEWVLEGLLQERVKVTAALLSTAIEALPDGQLDRNEIIQRMIELAQRGMTVVVRNDREEVNPFEVDIRRIRSTASKVAERAKKDPASARQFLDELAAVIEDLRKALSD
jgi:hypothetical protein